MVVEFAPALADAIDEAVAERSANLGHATATDIIREAVAAFLLPSGDTNQDPVIRNESDRRAHATWIAAKAAEREATISRLEGNGEGVPA
jgi:hypothetical protein